MSINLPSPIHTSGGRVRPNVRTVEEALRLISDELPAELRTLSRWTFARELFEVVKRTGKKRDMTNAVRQFKQALTNEGWLAAHEVAVAGEQASDNLVGPSPAGTHETN